MVALVAVNAPPLVTTKVPLPTFIDPPDIVRLLAFTAPSGVTLNGADASVFPAAVAPAQNA